MSVRDEVRRAIFRSARRSRRFTEAKVTQVYAENGRRFVMHTPAYDLGLWPGDLPGGINRPSFVLVVEDHDTGDEA